MEAKKKINKKASDTTNNYLSKNKFYYIKWSRECFVPADNEEEARKVFAGEANVDEVIEEIRKAKVSKVNGECILK